MFIKLGRYEQLPGNFRQTIQSDGGAVITEQTGMRVKQFAGIEIDRPARRFGDGAAVAYLVAASGQHFSAWRTSISGSERGVVRAEEPRRDAPNEGVDPLVKSAHFPSSV